MAVRCEAIGLKRLCLGAFAALYLAGTHSAHAGDTSDATSNPWGDSLLKYNIPYIHGSGVYVDLGNEKVVKSRRYREPAGMCPVMGKVITLQQPTTDAAVWPNDYLARVPIKDSAQDVQPLGGGFGMWETKPVKISPLTVSELQQMAEKQRKKNNPSAPATKKLEEVQDDHGLCAWWAWTTYAPNNSNNLDDKYRYPFVWDEDKKVCTLLAVSMQMLQGAGKYCTAGNDSPNLTWYCFYPEKTKQKVSYNSPYIRLDHASVCPEKPLNGAHFGVWNGTTCARMVPRQRMHVDAPEDCGKAVFKASASDNPTRYTQAPTAQGTRDDATEVVASMWPVGAFGQDQPDSKGVGVNYANWFSDGTCELYDTVPTCLTPASYQVAFTSLGSIDPTDAELPPCNAASEGWKIYTYCECGEGQSEPWECKNGAWVGGSNECECGSYLPLALGLSVGLLVPVAAIAGYFFYRRRRQSNQGRPTEKKRLLSEDQGTGEEFSKVDQRRQHKRSDFAQEAEPSFWGETQQDQTNVMIDDNTHEAYY